MGKYKGDSISIRGSCHVKNNFICQDNSDCYCDDKYAIAMVCDGHGGKKHFRSHNGSLFAVRAGIDAIQEFLGYGEAFTPDREKLLIQLEKNIILNWNQRVKAHNDEGPFTDAELCNVNEKTKESLMSNVEIAYGTTFIAVVMADKYCFGLQIGDGDCVILKNNGELAFPIPADDNLLFDITTSLCDKDAIMNFRHFWLDEPIAAAMVTTDGVGNSFLSQEYYLEFCKSVFKSYNDTEIIQANQDLNEFLPELSERGSGDDVSISIIFHREKLNDLLFHENAGEESGEGRVNKGNEEQDPPGETENEEGVIFPKLEGEDG